MEWLKQTFQEMRSTINIRKIFRPKGSFGKEYFADLSKFITKLYYPPTCLQKFVGGGLHTHSMQSVHSCPAE
jgi:hypothetical protein